MEKNFKWPVALSLINFVGFFNGKQILIFLRKIVFYNIKVRFFNNSQYFLNFLNLIIFFYSYKIITVSNYAQYVFNCLWNNYLSLAQNAQMKKNLFHDVLKQKIFLTKKKKFEQK